MWLLLTACGQRYTLRDMQGREVDVTSYIRSGAYRPDSCEGRLDRLVRTGIPRRDAGFNARLVQAYRSFRHSGDPDLARLPEHTGNPGRLTEYWYTYVPDDAPVDVYRTVIDTGNGSPLLLYIRLDEQHRLYGGYSLNHWVQNACDRQ
ncbi:hypothetical protein GCM10023184_43600 [Flaviaesturariibacter amylovorans]|uniref:Lipoprotein n=1 Tax=Flaviaesturariibacter amylovorans TaxID=1084520 RepID=A0ABP8HRW1_9BACT